jgi:hypothetical protein
MTEPPVAALGAPLPGANTARLEHAGVVGDRGARRLERDEGARETETPWLEKTRGASALFIASEKESSLPRGHQQAPSRVSFVISEMKKSPSPALMPVPNSPISNVPETWG